MVDGTTYVPLEMFNVLLGNGAVDLEDGKIVINTEINENNVQIPSPFIDCASLAEAGEVAGFEMRAPESVGDYDRVFISAIDGELIDVLYESGADTICVRKRVLDRKTSAETTTATLRPLFPKWTVWKSP